MRITELPTVSGASATDYLAIDDASLGTRKILPENLGFVSFAEDQTSVIDATEAAQARANIKISSATTSAEGLVQLYNGVDSTSTTLAATAAAVKLAYEHGGGATLLMIEENSVSVFPKVISNADVTSTMVLVHSELSNPSAQTGDWTVTTADGSVTISGTISGSTNIRLIFTETT